MYRPLGRGLSNSHTLLHQLLDIQQFQLPLTTVIIPWDLVYITDLHLQSNNCMTSYMSTTSPWVMVTLIFLFHLHPAIFAHFPPPPGSPMPTPQSVRLKSAKATQTRGHSNVRQHNSREWVTEEGAGFLLCGFSFCVTGCHNRLLSTADDFKMGHYQQQQKALHVIESEELKMNLKSC